MNNYRIIAYLQPFILEQKIELYENKNCVNIIKCTFNEMEPLLLELIEKHNIKDITFAGNAHIYSYKLKTDIISKYNKKDINITVLE